MVLRFINAVLVDDISRQRPLINNAIDTEEAKCQVEKEVSNYRSDSKLIDLRMRSSSVTSL